MPTVDHQAHWYSGPYLERLCDRETPPLSRRVDESTYIYVDDLGHESTCPPSFHSLEAHLADMDQHGVDISVISPNLLGEVSRLPIAEAVATTEQLNAEIGRAQREHPDRIVGLAMLPMQDADAALEVLERGVKEHNLAGICLLSNIAGQPITSDRLLPLYRRIEELDLPIYLHPSHTSVVDNVGYGPTIEIGLGWMFETGAAALSLIYTGVLDECPDLTIVHPHLGGALPAVVNRVVECEIGVRTKQSLRSYLTRNFYVDSVQKTPGAVPLAIETYGIERLVFGTDFPWIDRGGSRTATERALSGEQFSRLLANIVPNLRLPARI